MEKLLKSSLGYPKGEWTKTSTRIHELNKESDFLLQGCYWIPVDDELKAILSPVPTTNNVGPKPKPLKLWYDHPNGKLMGVPKFFGLSAFGKCRDKRNDGLDINPIWNEDFKLRDIQKTSVDQTLETLNEWGGAFYTADCGFGKSVVIAALIHRIKKRAMIVVPRLTLVKQTAHDLGGHKTLDRPQILSGSSVGILQGSWEKNQVDADIIVASLDSLSLFKYPREFWEKIGVVIFDEAHHMAAKTLSAIMPHVSSSKIVGFSATPTRNDGLEHVLYWLLGPTAFVYQRLPEITGKSKTVKVKRVKGAVINDEFMYGGKLNFSAMLNSISSNEERNKVLIEIAEGFKDRQKILLITAFREHCELLTNALEAKGERVEMMHGAKKRKRDDGPTQFLVATYGILEEGFDDADLDTLIFCTPRSTIQQTVGRIERAKDGKLIPLVIDVVDENKIFESMWYKRKKFYKSRGFEIEEKKKEEVWVANGDEEEIYI